MAEKKQSQAEKAAAAKKNKSAGGKKKYAIKKNQTKQDRPEFHFHSLTPFR